MTRKRVDPTGSFTATGEDGTPYPVHEFTEIQDVASSVDHEAERRGPKSLRIDLGGGRTEDLTRISRGRYTSPSGAIFRSDDPNAP
jgi:hypothetical protein